MIKECIRILKKKAHYLIPIAIACIIYVLLFSFVIKGHSSCPIKEIFGIPCPGCGMTRAYKAFFTGHFLDALYFHPLFFSIPFLAIILIFNEIPFLNKLYRSKFFWFSVVALFLLVYIIRFTYYFPQYPMNLSEGLFQRLF